MHCWNLDVATVSGVWVSFFVLRCVCPCLSISIHNSAGFKVVQPLLVPDQKHQQRFEHVSTK